MAGKSLQAPDGCLDIENVAGPTYSITATRELDTDNSNHSHHHQYRAPARWAPQVRAWLPQPSFINLHYLYFIFMSLLTSLIFWASSTPPRSVSYVDSLFLCVSGITEAGLNTVNLSELNTWQQIMLFLLIFIGSAVFVSSNILLIRKRAFERTFAQLAHRRRHGPHMRSSAHRRSASVTRPATSWNGNNPQAAGLPPVAASVAPENCPPHSKNNLTSERHVDVDMHVRSGDQIEPIQTRQRAAREYHKTFFEGHGVGAHGLKYHPRNTHPVDYSPDDLIIGDKHYQPPSRLEKYVHTVNGYLGRNSQVYHLTAKERRKLGGIEYDAICLLSWLVPVYLVLFQLLGALSIGAWIWTNRPDMTRKNGLDPFWTGAFFAISAFNNSGLALLDANATALQTSYFVLLTMSLLILAGNTCFPPFLRLILWTMSKAIPADSPSIDWQRRRRTIQFCLDHPRRVYTNLFNRQATWWLVFSLVILNGIDWMAFELLNLDNPVTNAIPTRFRVLDGLFQAFAVRSGGFYVVPIPSLGQGLLVLYVIMMYVSAFPVTMTIRNSNVYEERSLGIYAEDLAHADEDQGSHHVRTPHANRIMSGLRWTISRARGSSGDSLKMPTWTRQDYIRYQLRSQLGHDLWLIALAVFIIQAIEQGQFNRDPVTFATFNIIFETISAYGTVGISTGVPWSAHSFSGSWHTTSKLVLCVVMLRGRHRGLPVAIDRAVLMPDESLAWAEEEDGHMRSAHPAAGTRRSGHGVDKEGLSKHEAAHWV
ncbi:hypothetical protein PV10_04864 [Exophiala mesophila]|uniref:Potassium transport protein n=1 Tax=Exophiala mesophila TaxID=212818 RepID=A0A0D1ZIE8_EXOME|nr:uncharacterized protein PV10_04864 [Exophiala mesophila]KIV93669.1 hypothetical protein PV10_04864 [Exophiala mesophila]